MFKSKGILGMSKKTWRRRAQASVQSIITQTRHTTTDDIHEHTTHDNTTHTEVLHELTSSTNENTLHNTHTHNTYTHEPTSSTYESTLDTHEYTANTLVHEPQPDDEMRATLTDVSDSDSEDDNIISLAESLQIWAIKNNVTHIALSELLVILREHGNKNLPLDGRTLLRTPKYHNIVAIPPGNYCHIGLRQAIDFYLSACCIIPDTIILDFNIDGVPISRSSNSSFWLILTKIMSNKYPDMIFVVGVYHGMHKPQVFSDFPAPLVSVNYQTFYTVIHL